MSRSIMWFRQDLRIEDNPALDAAFSHEACLCLYLWNAGEGGAWARGAASRWWLHHSLRALNEQLEKLGSSLYIVTTADAAAELMRLTEVLQIERVYWNRQYEPWAIRRDEGIKSALGGRAKSFKGSLIWEPWEVLKENGEPYQVYSAFWRQWQRPTKAKVIPAPKLRPTDLSKALNRSMPPHLLPSLGWDKDFYQHWHPGKVSTRTFLDQHLAAYPEQRNFPALPATSRLSPHLHFGEISPRQLWYQCTDTSIPSDQQFLKEIVWREFSYYLLYHFPHTSDAPLKKEFADFPWSEKIDDKVRAWQQGHTGYPIVDAGMRELWTTGWMHNRVRMIVASFLVKDLGVHWLVGARWFWETLLDADLASNTQGWQWTAGCGADASPFFRVFNPTLQGEKFDPHGSYVRQWIHELADLPDKWVHRPWEAASAPYCAPIVDHASARDWAINAYKKMKHTTIDS